MKRKAKSPKVVLVEYSSNNSGGRWWLTDEQWAALEKAGWVVAWLQAGFDAKEPYPATYAEACRAVKEDKDRRWLGALATSATRHGLGLQEAVAEWEGATGASSTDAGCPCCGQPHSFTAYDEKGEYVASGPETHYEASW